MKKNYLTFLNENYFFEIGFARKESKLNHIKMKKVNKYTRASKNGKLIYCCECNKPTKVFHFSWSAITCNECDTIVNKYDWLLEPRQHRSNQGRSQKKVDEIFKLFIFLGKILILPYLIYKIIKNV